MAVMAVALSAQQPAGAPAAAPPAEKSEQQLLFERYQRGERVMNASCSAVGCHTIRPIQTAAMDQDGWSKTISAMLEKGAKVGAEDVPILTDYLVRFHGPLPEGEGKAIVLNICTMCHDLQRVRTHGGTVEDWFDLLNAMIGEGAPLTDEQIPVILKYLATNFPPH
jgi:mono/diheme cytochrome c family protein